jgi:hypothetical protein
MGTRTKESEREGGWNLGEVCSFFLAFQQQFLGRDSSSPPTVGSRSLSSHTLLLPLCVCLIPHFIFATTPLAQHSHACIQAPTAPTRVAKQVAKNGHLRLAQSVFHLSYTVGDIQAFIST